MTRTTRDDSKNFEVFVQFGTEVELLLDIPAAAANLEVNRIEVVDLDMNPEAGDVDKVEHFSVDTILDESSGLSLNLQCT